MLAKSLRIAKAPAALVLACAALLLLISSSAGQQNSVDAFPWQAHGYQGYNETPAAMQLINPAALPVGPAAGRCCRARIGHDGTCFRDPEANHRSLTF